MEDHNHQNHHHHYGSLDLRQFINSRPTSTTPFAAIPNHPQPLLEEAFTLHRTNLPPHQSHPHFDMMMLMPPAATSGLHKFRSDCSTSTTTTSAAAAAAAVNPITVAGSGSGSGHVNGLDVEGSCFGCSDGGTGRWPRQETLTLLEIRSRLDYKFKEANQKGPLWDEVSRIMSEEHGYQRSGKKCREKFENLYKYYKKTKEGKAGRQDGKHYRFFRQLEALCGDQTSSSNQQQQQLVSPAAAPHFLDHNRAGGFMFQDQEHAGPFQLQSQDQTRCDSLSLSSDFSSSSSGANVDGTNACEFDNDSTEKRRKRSGKSWKRKIKEFIDSKMRKLMERQEAWLEKITKTLEEKEKERVLREEEWRKQETERIERAQKFWAKERAWIEARDAALMESLHNFTSRDHHHGLQNRVIHEAQTENCSETVINRKPSSSSYFQSCNESVYNPGEAYNCNQQEQEATASNVNAPPPPPPPGNDSYFRFVISDGENLWENYGLKLNRGDHS